MSKRNSKKKKRNKSQQSWCQINFADSFSKIKKVHKNIPNFNFDCKNCPKNCCVSPYISIVEFVYVMRYIIGNFNEPHKVISKDNGRNADGFLMCPFLDGDMRCLIYPVRHYKCRMTGMDVLDDIFTEVCEHKKVVGLKSPEISKEEWYEWVKILTKANKDFRYDEQKTFQKWIQFYFEDKENLNDNENKVRTLIKNYLHIEEYIPYADVDDFF